MIFPIHLLQRDSHFNTEGSPHPPSPENRKSLDFGTVFSSIEKAKASNLLFVGEVILVLDEKEGSGTYVVKSTDPLELVEIGERIETIQGAEVEPMDEVEDPLRKYYKTADDEEPDCGACDRCNDGSLCDACGPEYAWTWYKRTLTPERERENE